MMKALLEYRLIIIITLLIISTVFVESPFHHYYYGEPPILLYFLITLVNLLIYLMCTDKFIFIEKFIYAAVLSIIVLLFGEFIVEKSMGLIYGYDLNWDELKSPKLLDNTLFFFVTNFIGITILRIWIKFKKPIYK